jgi:hypothetical protein
MQMIMPSLTPPITVSYALDLLVACPLGLSGQRLKIGAARQVSQYTYQQLYDHQRPIDRLAKNKFGSAIYNLKNLNNSIVLYILGIYADLHCSRYSEVKTIWYLDKCEQVGLRKSD